MTSDERRRYFRINETIGLSIQKLDPLSAEPSTDADTPCSPRSLDLINEHDELILSLLNELAVDSPKTAQLIRLLNQKIERVAGVLAVEGDLLKRIAHKVQEVNISACGLAFSHEERLEAGSRLKLELTLHPDDVTLLTEGIVVSCDRATDLRSVYYCRVEFLGMSAPTQEALIQHIVRRQSSQLKSRNTEYI